MARLGAFDAFVNDPDNELEDAEGGIVMGPVIDVQVRCRARRHTHRNTRATSKS